MSGPCLRAATACGRASPAAARAAWPATGPVTAATAKVTNTLRAMLVFTGFLRASNWRDHTRHVCWHDSRPPAVNPGHCDIYDLSTGRPGEGTHGERAHHGYAGRGAEAGAAGHRAR